MKGFFAELNFARVMILTCLVGSCVLGWFIHENYGRIKLQDEALAPDGRAAQLVREIQSLSKRYTELYDHKSDENLTAQGNPQTYISNIAGHEDVRLGRVDIKVSDHTVTNTVRDKTYTVTPQEREKAFLRSNIANFLWKVEADSRRVRVTQLTMTAHNSQGKTRVQPEEFPDDTWTFSCKITSRHRVGEEE